MKNCQSTNLNFGAKNRKITEISDLIVWTKS